MILDFKFRWNRFKSKLFKLVVFEWKKKIYIYIRIWAKILKKKILSDRNGSVRRWKFPSGNYWLWHNFHYLISIISQHIYLLGLPFHHLTIAIRFVSTFIYSNFVPESTKHLLFLQFSNKSAFKVNKLVQCARYILWSYWTVSVSG